MTDKEYVDYAVKKRTDKSPVIVPNYPICPNCGHICDVPAHTFIPEGENVGLLNCKLCEISLTVERTEITDPQAPFYKRTNVYKTSILQPKPPAITNQDFINLSEQAAIECQAAIGDAKDNERILAACRYFIAQDMGIVVSWYDGDQDTYHANRRGWEKHLKKRWFDTSYGSFIFAAILHVAEERGRKYYYGKPVIEIARRTDDGTDETRWEVTI